VETVAFLSTRHALPAPALESLVNHQTCAVGLFVCRILIPSVAFRIVRQPAVLRAAVSQRVNKFRGKINVPGTYLARVRVFPGCLEMEDSGVNGVFRMNY